MPPHRESLGERISSLEAKFDGFEKYTHDKWHDLHNTLQPLALLPERITREVGEIKRMVEPMSNDISDLDTRVRVLERDQGQMTGARRFAVLALQTLVSAIAAAASAIIAILAWGKHP